MISRQTLIKRGWVFPLEDDCVRLLEIHTTDPLLCSSISRGLEIWDLHFPKFPTSGVQARASQRRVGKQTRNRSHILLLLGQQQKDKKFCLGLASVSPHIAHVGAACSINH